MTLDFNKDEDFKALLKRNEPQIEARTKDGIQDHENFRLLRNILYSLIEEGIVNSATAILISKDDIIALEGNIKDKLFETLRTHNAVMNDCLYLDKNLNLTDYERKDFDNHKKAEKFYENVSRDLCVFLITPFGVNPFVDGENIGSLVFLTTKDIRKHRELKDMSQIEQLFDKYRVHLTYRYNYDGFFVPNSSKRSLHSHLERKGETKLSQKDFLDNNFQLLNNKPENRFRESLRSFLKENMRGDINFSKEHILESFKRLDINIIDNYGDLFFIEVKWVGVSIHADGEEVGTEYKSDGEVNPKAVVQTVHYIKELFDNEENIKKGYLVVFDARYTDLPDTLSGFDENYIIDEEKRFYPYFEKVSDFRIINHHPS